MQKSQHTNQYRKLTAALRKARESAELTQAEVAEKLGVYATFISKIEAGERRVDIVELAQLCRVYGIELIAFLRSAGLCE